MLPLAPGIFPFGAVMGTIFAEANLSLFQSMTMNTVVFAGASQLAAVNLMNHGVAIGTVVVTGLIINLRFLLYSAALSPVIKDSSLLTKFAFSYGITDQTYAVLTANQDKLRKDDQVVFYFGSAICMIIVWQSAVVIGYFLGNVAPQSWSLEFAIPLSFVALTLPSLKKRVHVLVAIFSSITSLLLYTMPYKLGLIATAFLAIGFGILITQKRGQK